MKTLFNCWFVVLFVSLVHVSAQNNSTNKNVFVDENGVMRWKNTQQEVAGFGVNYTVPFAHAYRSGKSLGVDIKKAIDNDVYHFSRLGFDLYRIHVWDTEISDTLGNLLQNEHLDTFDYLLKKLNEKNINYVITPIAFWGNGWPEPDTFSPGFSHKYGKNECLTNPDAIKAQQKYLFQFLNHVNPYTGTAYKNEANLLAFEVSNEPHHRALEKEVTKFIKGMVNSMRKTGCEKPIFYNVSHAVHLADAYFKAGIQGGTFQWYPTGLGYQRELQGNLLPNVNDYNIPFEKTIKEYNGAKLVYEFDAADVGKSYIYPAMARSFRTAGIQIAAHFAYDPTYLAYANTEYNTHYMNLVYAPQKALSLMIASEVFHQVPLYKVYKKYPKNTSFDNFEISYEEDLATYNAPEKFLYTNTNNLNPISENSLQQIAGFGNSNVINYTGLGAYFLDKISDGIWRLEIMPDAVWIENLFGKNSLHKTVAVINWETQKMDVKLNNLNENFSVEAININNDFTTNVIGTEFLIKPGTYILSKRGSQKKWNADDLWKNNKLNDFFAPKTSVTKTYLKHQPPTEITEEIPFQISAQIVAPTAPETVEVWANNGNEYTTLRMEKVSAYQYAVEFPKKLLKRGFLNYTIIVKTEDKSWTFPANKEGNPGEWDFFDKSSYEIGVVPSANPIYLFNAKEDADLLVKEWRKTLKLLPTNKNNEAEYQINIEKLFVPDNENLHAKPIYDYSFKQFLLEKIKGRKADLSTKNQLVFYGNSLNGKPCKLQIAFVLNDGSSFGKVIEIGTELKSYTLSLQDIKPVKTVTLPRPYPTFLPYYLEADFTSTFDMQQVESLQFSIGPEIPKNEIKDAHGISIISISLE